MKRTTIKDVAREAGVSVATASVALNGKPGVSDGLRKEILEAAKRLNYVPNSGARSLRARSSKCIGIIVPDLVNPFFGQLAMDVSEEISKYSLDSIITASKDSFDSEKKCLNMLLSRNVDGIIIVPSRVNESEPEMENRYGFLDQMRVPYVFVGIDPGIPGSNLVMTDMTNGESNLVKYLIKRGCSSIALLINPLSYHASLSRYEGYKQALEEEGIEWDEDKVFYISYPSYKEAYAITDQIWATRPDAIVTINDFVAMGVLKRLHELGVDVPRDLSVAGFDDVQMCEQLVVPLTSVRQPITDMAVSAVSLLMKLMNGEACEKEVLIETSLKIRGTTR